jgi:hypothetical protein
MWQDQDGSRNFFHHHALAQHSLIFFKQCRELAMNGIIYLVGLVVIVLAILSFLGLR